MSETTLRHVLPLLIAGQSHKEVVHNEALIRLDALVGAAIEGFASDPPPSPGLGACWVVSSAPTGAWTPHPGKIASWQEGGWLYLTPTPGFVVWVRNLGRHVYFDGSVWQTEYWPVASVQIGGKAVLSERQPPIPDATGGALVDVEARAAVAAILAALRSHGLIES